MHRTRFVTAVAAAATVSVLGATPAWAAPPTNDTIGGAVAASLGFSEQRDTSEATTDADDAQLNASCGAPATDASVWYTIDGTGEGVVVDVSQSSYSAGVLVGVGSPGSLQLVTCGPTAVGFFAESGTTYYVLAVDDQLDGSGNGGTLAISFSQAPPPPAVDITVNPVGTVDTRSGVATLTGTYTCTDADFVEVFGEANQPVGRFTVHGSFAFFDVGTCDGTAQQWTADVFPDNGKFAGGKAVTVAFAFACGVIECSEGFAEQTVRLRGTRR